MFRTLIAIVLLAGVLTACSDSGGYFGSSTIANGAIKVWHGEVTLNAKNVPPATISKGGDFSIDGKPVKLDADQRQLLLRYYAAATAVRQHGIETGEAGAALARSAVKGAVSSALHGDGADVGKSVDAQADRIKTAALKICSDLASIKSAQNRLATQLPAFKPYSNLVDTSEIDDCHDD